jgi:hypothetical protein
VKLQVIVRKDGSVAVQNVLEGDPILPPAAIEAVRAAFRPRACSVSLTLGLSLERFLKLLCVNTHLGSLNPSHVRSLRPVDPGELSFVRGQTSFAKTTLGDPFMPSRRGVFLCGLPLGVSNSETRKSHIYFDMTSRARWLAITSRTSSCFFAAASAASLDPKCLLTMLAALAASWSSAA